MFDPKDSRVWLDYADESYVSSRLLWFTGLSRECSFNAHRTIELYLKTYLVVKGKSNSKKGGVWGHNLSDLCELCGITNKDFLNQEFVRRIEFFQRYLVYPMD